MAKTAKTGRLSPPLTVLKVAHHGSRNSSHQEFIQQVNPVMAVISAGSGNRYGHPHKEVLERLLEQGTKTYITAETGAVIIRTDGWHLSVTTQIQAQ
jgi:competence protein ComEC